jgi:hypothetical protein
MARFRRDLQAYQDAWVRYSDTAEGTPFAKMRDSRIPAFMRALKPPLGIVVDKALSTVA